MASLNSRGNRPSTHTRSQPKAGPVLPDFSARNQRAANGTIDPELAFEAAVSIALSNGAIIRSGDASREASRFTDTSYVLMGTGNAAIQRLARAEIVAELERMARINSNLKQYQLRFRPGRAAVMVAVFAGFSGLVAAQSWNNMINDRRIASLEESYLEHQATIQGGQPTSELAAIETVNEFESRILKTKLDGCYDQAKANLVRATDSLKVAMQPKSEIPTAKAANLQLANTAYQEYKAGRNNCRNSLLTLFGWRPSI